MEKNALCLSGGGIKAFAHIGAIKALEESNIKFDMVAGTSSGSIIALLYALGYSSEEMYEIFKKYCKKIKYVDIKNIFKIIVGLVFRRKLIVNGLTDGKVIVKAIKEICKESGISNINEVKMPVIIPAVNLKNGELIVFSSKEIRNKISDEVKYVTDAPIDVTIRSSCSYPAVFSPYVWKGKQLVDGGIRENVAWKELKDIGATKVFGINFETQLKEKECCENMIEVAVRSMNMMAHELSNYELDGIDKLVTITTEKVGLLDTSKMDYLYETGYKTMKRYLKRTGMV